MRTINCKVEELIENEWYIVRNSGETPEIALHSSLYYLTVSNDGPRITLTEEQRNFLRQAAVDRYLDIIIRDMLHAHSGTYSYRGINRSIINYRRFCTFCDRQEVDRSNVQLHAAAALLNFLEIEVMEIKSRKRLTIINCSYDALKCFAKDLGIDLDDGFAELTHVCSGRE